MTTVMYGGAPDPTWDRPDKRTPYKPDTSVDLVAVMQTIRSKRKVRVSTMLGQDGVLRLKIAVEDEPPIELEGEGAMNLSTTMEI